MNLLLKDVKLEEKAILRNLIEYYEYDFSGYTGRDVNPSGTFEYKYLDLYWIEDHRHPFLLLLDDTYIGFALVRKKIEIDCWSMEEFFVLKKYRRRGLGRRAAFLLFKGFPGVWRIVQHHKNIQAQKFWRRIIQEFAGGSYRELGKRDSGVDGPCQEFTV